MEIVFASQAKDDLDLWKKASNSVVLKKIRALIESIISTPYQGIGKPELLKYNLSGCWSRRISHEH